MTRQIFNIVRWVSILYNILLIFIISSIYILILTASDLFRARRLLKPFLKKVANAIVVLILDAPAYFLSEVVAQHQSGHALESQRSWSSFTYESRLDAGLHVGRSPGNSPLVDELRLLLEKRQVR